MFAVALLIPGPRTARAEIVRLTAEGAASRAVEVSNVAAAAVDRSRATGESVTAADAARLPQVTGTAALAQLSSVPEFTLPFALPGQQPLVLVPDITTTYGASVKVSESLYSGGAITAQRAATRHDTEASVAISRQAVADARLEGRLAYWESVRDAANVEAARAQETRAKRLLDDTRDLLNAGMAVEADVLAAQERTASARVQVIAAENSAANALAQLRSLLQIGDGDAVELTDSLANGLPSPSGTLADLESQALARRSELAATAAQLAALHDREEIARSGLRPAIGAVAQGDYSRPNQRYFPEADEWKDSWSVGVIASLTLFDGGKTRAETAASRLTQQATQRDQEELRRRILLEVETGRHNLESAMATVGAADAARAAAEQREVAASDRHAAGLATMLEILDAQADLAGAEQQQINARASSWIAAAYLARAIGQ
jgi:outer membrane protein TolC